MTKTQPTELTVPSLEQIYDQLATAVDMAGPGKSELFLVKLALLQANALADPVVTQVHIASALRDL